MIQVASIVAPAAQRPAAPLRIGMKKAAFEALGYRFDRRRIRVRLTGYRTSKLRFVSAQLTFTDGRLADLVLDLLPRNHAIGKLAR